MYLLYIYLLKYLFIFVFGTAIGSFINVCIYRIPKGESVVSVPSHCVNCNIRLRARNLIPIFSFLRQRGKCHDCHEPISPRYIMIETLTGLIFTALLWKYNFTIEFIAAAFISSILIVVCFIDLEHGIIPDSLVITATIVGLIFFVLNLFIPNDIYGDDIWWNPLLGALTGSAILLGISYLGMLLYRSQEVMGGGDIKILFPVGLFLGWKLMLTALFLSIIIAGAACLFLIIIKKIDRKTTIPFGPFISFGTILAITIGRQLLGFYF